MKNKWGLADLAVFCSVVRCGSFTAAARELGYSGPYVSKRIAELESKLGAQLFSRTTRNIQITHEGQIAHSWAIKILESAEAMATDVANSRVSPSGSLRISTSLRLGRHHVAPILSRLVKDYPGLDIWLELVDRRVDLLEEGIDIDIRAGAVDEPNLVSRRVVKSNRILCATPEYLTKRGVPKRLTDLSQHECMLFRDGDHPFGTWRLEGPRGTESVRVSGNLLRSHHSDVVKNWALDGHGIILLSAWDAADKLRDGSFKRVLPEYHQKADVCVVTLDRPSGAARMKVCVDYLVEHLRSGPHALDMNLVK